MNIRTLSLAFAVAAVVGVAGISFAEDAPVKDAPKGDALKEVKGDAGAPKAKKGDATPLKVKVDGAIGKLELTDVQKTEIVKLRTDLKTELKKLAEEMEKLKGEAHEKELALLTPEQKAQLAELEEAAKKIAAAKEGAVKDGAKVGDQPKQLKSETENPVKLP